MDINYFSSSNLIEMDEYFTKEFEKGRGEPCSILFVNDSEAGMFGIPKGCRVIYYFHEGERVWHYVDMDAARRIDNFRRSKDNRVSFDVPRSAK